MPAACRRCSGACPAERPRAAEISRMARTRPTDMSALTTASACAYDLPLRDVIDQRYFYVWRCRLAKPWQVPTRTSYSEAGVMPRNCIDVSFQNIEAVACRIGNYRWHRTH